MIGFNIVKKRNIMVHVQGRSWKKIKRKQSNNENLSTEEYNEEERIEILSEIESDLDDINNETEVGISNNAQESISVATNETNIDNTDIFINNILNNNNE